VGEGLGATVGVVVGETIGSGSGVIVGDVTSVVRMLLDAFMARMPDNRIRPRPMEKDSFLSMFAFLYEVRPFHPPKPRLTSLYCKAHCVSTQIFCRNIRVDKNVT
jgi:hypothetical protein